MFDFTVSASDKLMLERLQNFIPENIFDAHAHIYNLSHMPDVGQVYNAYGTAGAARFMQDQKTIYGERKVRALFIPYPAAPFRDKTLRHEVNRWIVNELTYAPGCVCEIYTSIGDAEEELEAQLTDSRIKGFKCYHLTSDCVPTWNANIGEYLPEAAWKVADKHGLCITLHMVKELSLSDPDNLAYIKQMTAKYPGAKLILAHCARGFASWQTIEVVGQLKGITNLYYDMAAICDPATICHLVRQVGIEKVMWGSDYPIDRSHMRPVNVGSGFTWLTNCEALEKQGFHCNMLSMESMFALYQACIMLDATKEDVEKIFYCNAMNLFGL